MHLRYPVIAAFLALSAVTAQAQQTLDTQVLLAQEARDELRRAAEQVRRAQLALLPAMRTGDPNSPAAMQAREALVSALQELQATIRRGVSGERQDQALEAAAETEEIVREGGGPAEIERAFQELETALIAYETAQVARTGPTLDMDARTGATTAGDADQESDATVIVVPADPSPDTDAQDR